MMWSQESRKGTPDGSFPSQQGESSPDVDLLWERHAQAAYVTNTEDNDDLEEEDYVPDTLKSFFKQANDTLQNSQQSFLESAVIRTVSSAGDDSVLYEQVASPVEDEEDRRLKGEVLSRLQQQQAKMEGMLMQQQTAFMSPDILRTPPPHPVRQDLTYSQARHEAIEDHSDLLQSNSRTQEEEEIEISMEHEKEGLWYGSNSNPGEPEYVVEPEYEASQYEGPSQSYEAPEYDAPDQSHESPAYGGRMATQSYDQQMPTEMINDAYPEAMQETETDYLQSQYTPSEHLHRSIDQRAEQPLESTPPSSRQHFDTPQSQVLNLGDVDETGDRRPVETASNQLPLKQHSPTKEARNVMPAYAASTLSSKISSRHVSTVTASAVGPSTRSHGKNRTPSETSNKSTPASGASSSGAANSTSLSKRTTTSAQPTMKVAQKNQVAPASASSKTPHSIAEPMKSPAPQTASLDRLLRPTAAMSARQAITSKASSSTAALTPAAKRIRSTPTSGSSRSSEHAKSLDAKHSSKVTSPAQATPLSHPAERKTPSSTRSTASQTQSRLMQATASSAAHMRTCGCTPSPNSSPLRPSSTPQAAGGSQSHLNDSTGNIKATQESTKHELSSRLFQPTEASQARKQKNLPPSNTSSSGTPKAASEKQPSTHGVSRLMKETAASRAKATDKEPRRASVSSNAEHQAISHAPKPQADQILVAVETQGHSSSLQSQKQHQMIDYDFFQSQQHVVGSQKQPHPKRHELSVLIPESPVGFVTHSEQRTIDLAMSDRMVAPSVRRQSPRVCPTCGRDCHCPPSRTGTPPKRHAVLEIASHDSALRDEQFLQQTASINPGVHVTGNHVVQQAGVTTGATANVADNRGVSSSRLQGTAATNARPADAAHSVPGSSNPMERLLRDTAASQARHKASAPTQRRSTKSSSEINTATASHFLQPTVSSLAHEGILENDNALRHVELPDDRQAARQFVSSDTAKHEVNRKSRPSAAKAVVPPETQKRHKRMQQGFAAPTATSERRSTLSQGPNPLNKKKSHSSVGKEQVQTPGYSAGQPVKQHARESDQVGHSRPRVTVPHTPKFATTARYGEKEVKRDPISEISLAQSTEVLLKGLREETSGVARVPSKRTRVTLPQAPNLATTKRYGEKVAVPGRGGSADLTLAQSDNVLARQLRGSDPLVNARRTGLTVPVAPKFQPIAKRELPKSTEERELEEMEYHKQHPFKARPVLSTAPQPVQSKPKERRLTVPEPFHLQSDQRASVSRPVVASPDREQEDLEELKKQFHARPMPSFKPKGKVVVPSEAKVHKPVTIPQPFVFASDQRIRNNRRNVATSLDTVELGKKFHAKPVPSSTYEAPPPKPQLHVLTDTSIDLMPPNLVTSQRNEKRSAAAEASRRKAEALAHEREMQARMRQRQKHQEAIQKAEFESTPKSAESLKPFDLKSSQRHEEYRRQLESRLRAEEEERRRQMAFHAREYKSPPPPEMVRVHKTTEPEPFHLASVNRHKAFTEEQRRMLEEEEQERKRQAAFHAKPLPRTTYTYRQVSPRHSDSASPFSPHLESKGEGALSPHEFDAAAEQIREAEFTQRQMMQAQRGAKQQTPVREYHLLPFGGRS